MSFIPDASVLLAYSLACLVLFITPGPDMSLFLAKTIAGGRAAGIAAMTGTSLGCVVHSLLAAFGLSALIAASPAMFLALKIVGALYLLWLAVDAVRNGSSLNVKPGAGDERAGVVQLGARAHRQSHQSEGGAVLPDLPAAVRGCARSARRGQAPVSRHLLRRAELSAGRAADPRRRAPSGLPESVARALLRAIDWLFAGVFSVFAVRILTTQAR